MTTSLHRWIKLAGRAFLLLTIVLQAGWIAYGGIITIVSETHPPFCVYSYPINVFLAEHYDGGQILRTDYPFQISEAAAGIHFSNIIYEGNKGLWDQALHHPETTVSWVILQPGDIVDLSLARYDPVFTQQFTLVVTTPYGLRLYHKNGLPPLPTRQLSSYLQSERQACTLSNPQQK